ncbi:unnamed protein product [Caenorhabditis brenneri]
MRITVLLWFLIFFPQNAISAPSQLQLIAEDFRILSRIVNAIHLSSSTINDDQIIQDVLSELLRISLDRLHLIIQVDVGTAKKEINRMHKEIVAKKLKDSKMSKKEKGKLLADEDVRLAEDLKVMLASFNGLAGKIHILEEAVIHKKEDLIEEVLKLRKSSNLFDNTCFKLDFKNLKKFGTIFTGDSNNFTLPSDVELAQTLLVFKKNSKNTRDCLREIESIEKKFSMLNIQNILEKYRNVFSSFSIASHFAIQMNAFQGNEAILEVFDVILAMLENSRSIWAQGAGAQGAIASLNNSMTTMNLQRTLPELADRGNTAGFQHPKDILKIFEDFKSPWFLKKVTKGKSTKKLVDAFQPYRKVAESISTLSDSWDILTNLAPWDHEVPKAATSLQLIHDFAANASLHFENVKKYGKAANRCFKIVTQKFDKAKLTRFRREQNEADYILNQIKTVGEMASQLKSSALEELNHETTRRQSFEKVMEVVTQPISLNVNSTNFHEDIIDINLMEKRKSLPGTDFFGVLFNISALSREMNKLKKNMEGINTVTTVSIKDILDELKVIEVAKCFKKIGNLNFEIPFDALTTIELFPVDTIAKMNEYLTELANVQTNISATYKLIQNVRLSDNSTNSFLTLNGSRLLVESLGLSIEALEDLEKAHQHQSELLALPEFPDSVKHAILKEGLIEWLEPKQELETLFTQIARVDFLAGVIRKGSLQEMAKVFRMVSGVHGITGSRAKLNSLAKFLHKSHFADGDASMKYFDRLNSLDLDLGFAKHQARLLNTQITVATIQKFFDDVFGEKKKGTPETITIEKQIPVSWIKIISFVLGFLVLILVMVLFGYGFTERGRTQYKNLYLFYFGKKEEFEKRWRYSLFMDTVDGKNALLDAVREGSAANALRILKKGAFINVYNKFGNTSLHFATKVGYADLVQILIKNGADRSLLNSKNLTPVQMIPQDYENTYPDRVAKYDQIKKIYKKYEKTKFRIRVPQEFSWNSFHIYPDESTDVTLTNKFLEAFRSIVLDEPSSNATHIVFRTDEDGMLVTDSVDSLSWIFHGVILLREQYMEDCLNDESIVRKDTSYLIENVKYRGVVYNTVLQWTEAMAKGTMPYLHGVFVTVVALECKNLLTISNIVTSQGGVFLNWFPIKEHFNIGSRPYLHAHLGPLFLIHSGKEDLTTFRNDPDRMYTLFTEEEFMVFMLKREINRDTRPNPPSVMIREE